MRFIFVFLIAILKFGTLKTEPIDYDRKNGQINAIFPPRPNIPKYSHQVDNDWNVNDLKFQPNESTMRKTINIEDIEDYENEVFDLPEEQFKSIDQLNDAQMMRLSHYLVKLLQRPGDWEAPLVLVRDAPDNNLDDRVYPLGIDNFRGISKRSRYYRPYPWLKRQNSSIFRHPHVYYSDNENESYDYDSYNPCTPSKNDVFELLKALHEQRQGNKSRVVSFCNRRRPASAVFTNIRFLGRKRK